MKNFIQGRNFARPPRMKRQSPLQTIALKTYKILSFFFKKQKKNCRPRRIQALIAAVKIFKPISRRALKNSLSLAISFQLAVFPYIAAAESVYPLAKKRAADLEAATAINEDVQSLSRFIFNPKDSSEGYYKNHPLDFYGLLGQQVVRLIKTRTHKEIRGITFYKEVLDFLNKLERDADLSAQHPEIKKQAEEIKNELENKNVPQKISHDNYNFNFEGQLKRLLAPLMTEGQDLYHPEYADQALYLFKRMQAAGKESISYKNLIVEILEDTEDETKPLRAVLSHPEKASIAPKLLEKEQAQRFMGSIYSSQAREKLSFKLSFHNKKTTLFFPQNIQWMSFFGPYLMFLEPSKVSESQAVISFIDLEYFEPAIGRAELPIFQIPVNLKNAAEKNSILFPQINITKDGNFILTNSNGSLIYKISLKEMKHLLAQPQQLGYNIIVSLLDPESAKESKEYIKNLIDTFSEHAESSSNWSLETLKAGDTAKNRLLEYIEVRKKIGSEQSDSGNYAKIRRINNKLQRELAENEKALTAQEQETIKNLESALDNDSAFQNTLERNHSTMAMRTKMENRFLFLASQLTKPQPFGAPKIKQALALLGHSVLAHNNLKTRMSFFKEGASQLLYSRKNRFAGKAVLLGAALGLTASGETAMYVNSILEYGKNWISLFQATYDSVFQFASPENLKQAPETLSQKGRWWKYPLGITMFILSALLAAGGIHGLINSYHLAKDIGQKQKQTAKKEVISFLKMLNNFRKGFTKKNIIQYAENSRLRFNTNLQNAARSNKGFITQIHFGAGDIHSQNLLKIGRLQAISLYSAMENSDQAIHLTIEADNIILDFKSEPAAQAAGAALAENQISISTFYDGRSIERLFTLYEGNIKDILMQNSESSKLAFNTELPISLHFSSEKDLDIQAPILNIDFTFEEDILMNDTISEIEKERGYDPLGLGSLSSTEIKTFKRALLYIAMGFGSFAKTFEFSGRIVWNTWFFLRAQAIYPINMAKVLWYSKYFERGFNQDKPTALNGGLQSRLSKAALAEWIAARRGGALMGVRQALEDASQFENDALEFERIIMKEVKTQAHIELAKLAAERAFTEDSAKTQRLLMETFPKAPQILENSSITDNKLRMFEGIYTDTLFKQVMKSYISEKAGGRLNNRRRAEWILKNQRPFSKKPSLEEARQRVKAESQKNQTAEKAREKVDSFFNGFITRLLHKSRQRNLSSLDSSKNTAIGLFDMADKLLKDPEGITRVTRYMLSFLKVNMPAKLLFTILILGGIDSGTLQVFHDQFSSENSFFWLGSYPIWTQVLGIGLILAIFGEPWFKAIMDSNLVNLKGFNSEPKIEDLKKKAPVLKWMWKQSQAKDNSWGKNYNFAISRILKGQWLPAAINYGAIYFMFLGHFEIEAFLGVLFFYFVGWEAFISFKMENVFEKSHNMFGLIEFYRKGVNLVDNEKLKLHPRFIEFQANVSERYRDKFNLSKAPIEYLAYPIIETFTLGRAEEIGDKAFFRLLFGGKIPSEYWVDLMDFLKERSLLPENFAEKCKYLFTKKPDSLIE